MDRGVAIVLDRQRRTSELHRTFLELRAESHAHFLSTCRQLADVASARRRRRPPGPPSVVESFLDLQVDHWLADHRPNWTVPVVPMMFMVDKLAQAAAAYTGGEVVAVHDLRLRRWLPVRGAVRLRTHVKPGADDFEVALSAWREAATPELSRFELVATANVRIGLPMPSLTVPFEPLANASLQPDPYRSGALFHGASFQYLSSWSLSSVGASGVLDCSCGVVPRGLLHQGLLDGALHVIPAQALWQWSPSIGRDVVGIPHRLAWLEIYEPLPDVGSVNVEARFAGFENDLQPLPIVDLQLSAAGRILAAFRVIMGLLPLGRLANASPTDRRAFLADRRYVAGVSLSTSDRDLTTLSRVAVTQVDWPPGSIAEMYGLPTGAPDRVAVIAVKEHIARKFAVHPSTVAVTEDIRTAWITDRPVEPQLVEVTWQDDAVSVRTRGGDPT